jgi:hypothetical protein
MITPTISNTPSQGRFCRIGSALYGDDWQSPLARALDVATRTVHRWANGQNDVPDWVWGRLVSLAPGRMHYLETDTKQRLLTLQGLMTLASAAEQIEG